MVSGLQSKNFRGETGRAGSNNTRGEETPGGYATGVQNHYRKGQRAVHSKS
jgi:hypothetical protein